MKKAVPGSVIHGTHRYEDLIPAFTKILEKYAPEKAAQLRKEYGDVYDAVELGAICLDLCLDGYIWLVEDLFDALNELAPEGYYFGAHPGDGSDFGFWEVDSDL